MPDDSMKMFDLVTFIFKTLLIRQSVPLAKQELTLIHPYEKFKISRFRSS